MLGETCDKASRDTVCLRESYMKKARQYGKTDADEEPGNCEEKEGSF
jgi:hypothetical protein